MSQFDLVEIARRLENLIRNGTIAEANYPAARVRVKYDEDENGNPVLTNWLPWQTHRAGSAIDWWPPEVGEQVTILSPSGDMANGVVVPSIYQTAHPAPSNDPNKRRVNFGDGSFVEYDRSAHKFTLTVNGGNVAVSATGNIDAVAGGNADITAGGNVAVAASGTATIDAASIHHNGGTGVVTKECICHLTGLPHGHGSSKVTAGM
jgi:phage baseplate assembly protein V